MVKDGCLEYAGLRSIHWRQALCRLACSSHRKCLICMERLSRTSLWMTSTVSRCMASWVVEIDGSSGKECRIEYGEESASRIWQDKGNQCAGTRRVCLKTYWNYDKMCIPKIIDGWSLIFHLKLWRLCSKLKVDSSNGPLQALMS